MVLVSQVNNIRWTVIIWVDSDIDTNGIHTSEVSRKRYRLSISIVSRIERKVSILFAYPQVVPLPPAPFPRLSDSRNMFFFRTSHVIRDVHDVNITKTSGNVRNMEKLVHTFKFCLIMKTCGKISFETHTYTFSVLANFILN